MRACIYAFNRSLFKTNSPEVCVRTEIRPSDATNEIIFSWFSRRSRIGPIDYCSSTGRPKSKRPLEESFFSLYRCCRRRLDISYRNRRRSVRLPEQGEINEQKRGRLPECGREEPPVFRKRSAFSVFVGFRVVSVPSTGSGTRGRRSFVD